MQLDLGHGALQPQQKSPIERSRIVDAIPISDQTRPVAAQVEQRIPIRAVPGEPGDLGGQDNTDLPQGDAGDQLLEATTMLGGRSAQAEIGVDHLDGGLLPAELASALAERVLQAQALLVGQHLMRAGLTDVDHGLAGQVPGCDEFRVHGSPPDGRWRRARREVGLGPSVVRRPGSGGSSRVARRTSSWMAWSVSLLAGMLGAAGRRLVASIGIFSMMSPW